jgi:hypothetical protein
VCKAVPYVSRITVHGRLFLNIDRFYRFFSLKVPPYVHDMSFPAENPGNSCRSHFLDTIKHPIYRVSKISRQPFRHGYVELKHTHQVRSITSITHTSQLRQWKMARFLASFARGLSVSQLVKNAFHVVLLSMHFVVAA